MNTNASFKSGLLINNDIARFRFRKFMGYAEGVPVPTHLDRRFEMLPSSNQGNTPRCAAYAIAGVVEYWTWKYRSIKVQIEPDPIYKRAKEIDGFPGEEGTTLEAVAQAAIDLGLLPIDPLTFQTVATPNEVKRALHKHGVLLSAFACTTGWGEAQADGWIKPAGTYLGGHAAVLCGFSDIEQPPWYGLQNSWGEEGYGWKGFCRMSPAQFQSEFLYGLVWETR